MLCVVESQQPVDCVDGCGVAAADADLGTAGQRVGNVGDRFAANTPVPGTS
jgi:hypothetical protein